MCPLAYKVCHLTSPDLENILSSTKRSPQASKPASSAEGHCSIQCLVQQCCCQQIKQVLYNTGRAMFLVYLLWLITLSTAVGKGTQTMLSFSSMKSQLDILDQCIKTSTAMMTAKLNPLHLFSSWSASSAAMYLASTLFPLNA